MLNLTLPSAVVVQQNDQVRANIVMCSIASSRTAISSGDIFFIYVSVYETKNESKILMKDWHKLLSIVDTISFKLIRNYRSNGSTNVSLIFLILGNIFGFCAIFSGIHSYQLSKRTSVPRAWGSV